MIDNSYLAKSDRMSRLAHIGRVMGKSGGNGRGNGTAFWTVLSTVKPQVTPNDNMLI